MSRELGPRSRENQKPRELFVEFDGSQLTIRTDVSGVYTFVMSTYRNMLVPSSTSSAGLLEVLRRGSGYTINGGERLDVPRTRLDKVFPYLKEEIVLQFIRFRPDLLWLHAAAVERNDRALLACGASGQGKSTLATMLCERGWNLMSDDVAPVRMDTDDVLPFYQRPMRRIHPSRHVDPADIGDLEREHVRIPVRQLRGTAARVTAIVLPRYAHGARTKLERLSQGDAAIEILRNARNFIDHKNAGVSRIAKMVSQVRVFALRYGKSSELATVLQQIL